MIEKTKEPQLICGLELTNQTKNNLLVTQKKKALSTELKFKKDESIQLLYASFFSLCIFSVCLITNFMFINHDMLYVVALFFGIVAASLFVDYFAHKDSEKKQIDALQYQKMQDVAKYNGVVEQYIKSAVSNNKKIQQKAYNLLAIDEYYTLLNRINHTADVKNKLSDCSLDKINIDLNKIKSISDYKKIHLGFKLKSTLSFVFLLLTALIVVAKPTINEGFMSIMYSTFLIGFFPLGVYFLYSLVKFGNYGSLLTAFDKELSDSELAELNTLLSVSADARQYIKGKIGVGKLLSYYDYHALGVNNKIEQMKICNIENNFKV